MRNTRFIVVVAVAALVSFAAGALISPVMAPNYSALQVEIKSLRAENESFRRYIQSLPSPPPESP